MSRQNVYAFTEVSGTAPGYVSVNKENSGEISVTVREPNGIPATINLSREEFAKLVKSGEEFLAPEGGERKD